MSDSPRVIAATCERCGATHDYDWELRGRIADCPGCGNWLDVPDPAEEFVFPDEPLEPLPEYPELGLTFTFVEGLPQPIWEGVLERHPIDGDPQELMRVYSEAATRWLETLQSYLPLPHRVTMSENFAILSPQDDEQSVRIIRTAERYRTHILKLLDGAARDEGYGPHVALVFDGHEVYYRYVAAFFSEGEYGASGGIMLNRGYAHVALPLVKQQWHATLAHELTHVFLHHLRLPAWLDEGITQWVESTVAETNHFAPSHASMRKQREFWNGIGLQEFWTGASFFRVDDGQKHSYELAEILVRNLHARSKQQLADLLNHADAGDAGSGALRASYRLSLGELIAEVLGPGEWEPRLPVVPATEDSLATG
jgi:hypothetical protein